jgi:hypothetical protein
MRSESLYYGPAGQILILEFNSTALCYCDMQSAGPAYAVMIHAGHLLLSGF